MRILHLSDFHFKSPANSKFYQDRMISGIISKLQNGSKPDLVFFTGDLVHSGTVKSDFEDAYDSFFQKISKEVGIPLDRFILCPGNHDVDRNEILASLNQYFNNSIKSNQELNDFVNSNSTDYQNSLKGTANYTDFLKINQGTLDEIHDLYTLKKVIVDDQEVSIVSLNSAWRSFDSVDDFGNLYFPTYLLEELLHKTQSSKFKILLIHHPLHWFKEFNSIELQNLIHSSFQMVFTGHVHKGEISSHYMLNNGIFAHSAPAVLCFSETSNLGYAIIEKADLDDSLVQVEKVSYNSKENTFFHFEKIYQHIPCGKEKHLQNKFREKIYSKFKLELSNSNDLLLQDKEDTSFLDYFTDPVIKTKSKSDAYTSEHATTISVKTLTDLSENAIILGKDKSGKTSLLKKIQLDHLKSFSYKGIVPFYLDYHEWEARIDDRFDLLKILANYYELNKSDTKKLISEHQFCLLIDNYQPKSQLTPFIKRLLAENPSVKYLACTHETTSKSVEIQGLDGKPFLKYFVHDLTRAEIRIFSEKWKNFEIDNKNTVINKIISICTQLEMPLNYWTISLLLLIHKKSKSDVSKNLFEVLDLCVDEILGKKILTLTRSKVSFTQLKKICSDIAYLLLTRYKDFTYSIGELDLRNFIEDNLRANPRLNANGKEIFEYLLSSGILKFKEDETITFRLNGIFEYFLAFYITQNDDFKDYIIKNDDVYLSFKNELELYSGFKRDDLNFVRRIYDKTREFFYPINEKFKELGTPDEILLDRATGMNNLTKIARKIVTDVDISSELRDELMEQVDPLITESEIKLKKLYDINQIDCDLYERYIAILARVFKNSDEIKDPILVKEIFEFLLETYCNFGFFILEELEKTQNNIATEDEFGVDALSLLKLITTVAPIMSQVAFYDGVGHFNIENVVKEKINELKGDAQSNQYKLFLLYFLLLDVDFKSNKQLLNEILSILNLSILKTSVVFKLHYYLAFKDHKTDEQKQFLKNKLQQAQLGLNSKTDLGDLHQSFESVNKQRLIRKDEIRK